MSKLSAEDLVDAVYFWNADQPNGVFSQWYPRKFTANGKEYPTAEHYMMSAKASLFKDHEMEEKIRKELDPEKVRDLGRQIKNFDGQIWNKHKFDLVCDGNRAKFSDPELRTVMLDTGDRYMVEASPVDRIWGVGFVAEDAPGHLDEWGENLMGHVMMKVRSEIRANQ